MYTKYRMIYLALKPELICEIQNPNTFHGTCHLQYKMSRLHHRGVWVISHKSFCNQLLTIQGIILGDNVSKNGCLVSCRNRNFGRHKTNKIWNVKFFSEFDSGHGVVVSIQDSKVPGSNQGIFTFTYFVYFCLKFLLRQEFRQSFLDSSEQKLMPWMVVKSRLQNFLCEIAFSSPCDIY